MTNTKPFFTENSWGWKLYHLYNQRKRLNMETIDCTPTWEGLLPALLELHVQFSNKVTNVKGGYKQEDLEKLIDSKKEFRRMAQAADKWYEYCKSLKQNK